MAAAVAVVVIVRSFGVPVVRHRMHSCWPVFNLSLRNFIYLYVFNGLVPCGPVPVVSYSCILIRKYSRM